MSKPFNALRPDQAFIDKHMKDGLREIMRHTYSITRRGALPDEVELSAFIGAFTDRELLEILKSHPSSKGNPAMQYAEAAIIGWARS